MQRWIIIRHVRWCWHAYQLARWMGLWRPFGYGHASIADLEYLDDVWEGRA